VVTTTGVNVFMLLFGSSIHLLPALLTRRELAILASPSWLARTWMATGKPVYMWFTRSVLGWEDREGAGDRDPR